MQTPRRSSMIAAAYPWGGVQLGTRWHGEDGDGCLSTVAPRVLATLMTTESDVSGRGRWRPDELGEILKHQLEAPLVFDLGTSDSQATADDPPAATDPSGTRVSNFGELFLHARPPLQLLRLTKRFAKTSDRRQANPLPEEVATVLYYAAIVAALLRHGERISRVSDSTLREGVDWVLEQEWVTGLLRGLFEEARGAITPGAGPNESR
jgi:hypothetical protein